MSAREIKAAHRAFAEAAVRHDLDGIASVFAIDAIIMPPDAEMVEGRDAIRRHWKGILDGGLSGLEINPTGLQVIGDVAIEVGHATLSMAPAGAAATDTNVKYIEIWKKVRGHWRVYRGMWNARSPAWGGKGRRFTRRPRRGDGGPREALHAMQSLTTFRPWQR
jgi:uncharacterized protein (TIGR02246 family)